MTQTRAPGQPGSAARARDVAAVLVVVVFGVLPFPDEAFRAGWPVLTVALLPVLVLPSRRSRPLLALAVSVACVVVVALAGTFAPSALLAVAITAFSAADRTRRPVAVVSVLSAALAVFLVAAVPLDGDLLDPRVLQFVLFVVLGGALGDASRSRREAETSRQQVLDAVTERAERAERDLDDEARRRVTEERVRIARDLHDVVAHQIAVISLSAGVASSSMETRPERAREALTTIRSASRTVLTDIGGLMALLRADDADDLRDLHPQAGLAQVDELVARFEGVGLRVDLDRAPGVVETAALSPASDHVAYLVLQEGLTNAHKHGTGDSAAVVLRSGGGTLDLSVTNPVRPGAGTECLDGHGLRGLRERVASVRGRVETSQADGLFRLDISVPVESRVAL